MRRRPLDEGERWWQQARADLEWAQLLAREGGWHLACFLAQQVAEKGPRTFLYAQVGMVIGHPVCTFGACAAERESTLVPSAEKRDILDTHYILRCYPNGLPDASPAQV